MWFVRVLRVLKPFDIYTPGSFPLGILLAVTIEMSIGSVLYLEMRGTIRSPSAKYQSGIPSCPS